MIQREFTLPSLLAQVRRLSGPLTEEMSSVSLTLYRLSLWLKSPRPYLMLCGFALFLATWYLAVEVWKLPRFREMPGITAVVKEWISPSPTYGLSLYTAEYYQHIAMSVWRVAQAFFLATLLGVPVGLLLGWSKAFKEYVFPVFELLRPIPVLAWVPLAIVMFIATESAVVFLAFLASFFTTALNTMLGVESIDESYVRAAKCLGANRRQVFRHVIIPGALPLDRGVVVFAGRSRNGLGPIRPWLRDQHVLHDGPLSDDHHRHGYARYRRLHDERARPNCRRLPDGMARARACTFGALAWICGPRRPLRRADTS